MSKRVQFFRKFPSIYSILRMLYTPVRNLKINRSVKYYSSKGCKALENVKKEENNIFFFGMPIHKNLGDLAQFYCIKKWLKSNYSNYNIFCFETYSTYSKLFFNKFLNRLNDNSIIVFQSGYCTKENHLDHKMHRKIVNKCKNNKIIFFPQTVNFFDKRQLDKTAKIYNFNGNVVFLARDNISYDTAIKKFSNCKVLLFPDIVTSLIGTLDIECNNKNGLLLCLRNDGEKLFDDSEYNCSDLISKYKIIDKCDTNSLYSYDDTIADLEKVLIEFVTKISKYKLIITDRYHGTIFSLIANTRVIVVPTNDHKVITGAHWFDNIYDSICIAKNPTDAIEIAKKIESFVVNNSSYFKENYYDKLKSQL